MDLSIIIVNYKTKEITKQTIDSVLSSTKNITYEIFLVDNDSKDGSKEFLLKHFNSYSNIHFIWNNENGGFSKANNLAIKEASGKYILLLNSDTIVKKDCLENCLIYIKEHEEIGALGCKVMLQNGQLDHTCKRGFPTPLASLYYFLKLHKIYPNNRKFGRYTMSYLSQDSINEVDALVGAFMLIPKKVIEKVGLLDEKFFMYGEDLDWCYRIKEAGYKIVYYPKSEIIHLKGVSSKKKKVKTIYEFHRAMILFFDKHYKNKYNFIVRYLVYTGVWTKMFLTYLQNVLKKE